MANQLNFVKSDKLLLNTDNSKQWNKAELSAPIGIIEEAGKYIAKPFTAGTEFIGLLASKYIPFQEVYVEPLTVGNVYTVRVDGGCNLGDLLSPVEDGNFGVDANGLLKVVKNVDGKVYEAVAIAKSNGGGGGQGITYTAGNGIKIAGTKISIDENVVATDTELTDEVNKLNLKDTELEKKINDIDLTKEIQDRTDADTVLQNNIDTEKTERTAKDTELEGLITKETTEREAEDTNINNKIDGLKKIYAYANGLEIKQNDLILHANKIYIANKDMTLDTWDVDEPNLTLTDSDTISCVNYEADITINKGQLVIYNNTLYLCDTTIDKTTTWDADKDKMIAQQVEVDLTEYYNKTETNNLLDNKEDLLKAGDDINIDKAGGNVIKVSSNVEATANSIPKRDAEGQLKSKMPAVLENDTVINNEKLIDEVNKLEQADTDLSNKIGDLTALTTTSKDTVVNSINEVNSKRIEHITQDEYNQKVIDDSLEADITYIIHSNGLTPTQAQYNDLLNVIYPVGSIYLSLDDNFIPSTAFGGIWEKIQTGRYLQATDTGAGAEVAESLPDIQGQQNEMLGRANTKNATGAFETVTTPQAVLAGAATGAAAWGRADNFKASRYCSVYKDGAKVQPDSIKVIMWKRIK